MARQWKDVKAKIEAELDAIMWEEPLEVKMSRLGVFPSGAGAHGQYIANLLFLVADTQAMSWWTTEPAMLQALEDPDLDVEACKKFWKYQTVHMAHLMGDADPPRCPAPWMNLPKLSELCDDIVDSFATIATKEELGSLLWSWFAYMNPAEPLVLPDLPMGGRRQVPPEDARGGEGAGQERRAAARSAQRVSGRNRPANQQAGLNSPVTNAAPR